MLDEPPTATYLGPGGLAEALGVSRAAVHKWRSRYPPGSAPPVPRARRRDRRGAGLAPRTARRGAALARVPAGLTREEAVRTLATFVDEFPEKSESDIHAWLVDEWRDWRS